MEDDLLRSIDATLAARNAPRSARRKRGLKTVRHEAPEAAGTTIEVVEAQEERFGWIEVFLSVQFLWGVMLFVPGAQQYRGFIRALPYLMSLGTLTMYVTTRHPGRWPRGAAALIGALLLLTLNLLHATTQLSAGLAQCVFQLSIAAPLFWAGKVMTSARRLERVLVLLFIMNAASAGLGILQVYFPAQFMPPEFSSLGSQLNQYYLDGLTYIGNDDRTIVRPPGLTDQPGGAAMAGAITAIIGLGLILKRRPKAYLAAVLAMVTVGFAVIYLTQVRSVLLVAIGACTVLAAVSLRRGRVAGAGAILLVMSVVVVASFAWASSLGGASVDDRFLDLRHGVVQAYQENRGSFLADTVGDLLNKYPLGAGVGRWGMMNIYFGDRFAFGAAPLYVEIQLTGWLLDGGLPMWILYGGAIVLALLATLRLTATASPRLAELATVCLAVQAFIVALGMASPVFNNQMGMLFWIVAGLLCGVAAHDVAGDEVAA